MPKKVQDTEWLRVGATVREMRQMRGLKPDELANAIPMSRSYLANIEAGRKRLQPIHAARIAQILDVRQISILRPEEFPVDLQEAS